jgi:hypothetical protein
MKHRLLYLLTALSLLFWVAVCLQWARGRSHHDSIGYTSGHQTLAAGGGQGYVFLAWNSNAREAGFSYLTYLSREGEHPLLRTRHVAGFGVRLDSTTPALKAGATRTDWRVVVAPSWAVAAALAVLPAMWLRRRRVERARAKRSLAGLCLRCGYDLRATPGRCPECGHIAAGTATSARPARPILNDLRPAPSVPPPDETPPAQPPHGVVAAGMPGGHGAVGEKPLADG